MAMKTMETLCKRFNRMHGGYTAELETLESYRGCYRVYITDAASGITCQYIFTTCREFREWMDGVVLD